MISTALSQLTIMVFKDFPLLCLTSQDLFAWIKVVTLFLNFHSSASYFFLQMKVIWFQKSFPFQGSVAVDKLCLGRRPPPHWAELPPLCTTWLEQCEAKSISETQKIQIHTDVPPCTTWLEQEIHTQANTVLQKHTNKRKIQTHQTNCWSNVK